MRVLVVQPTGDKRGHYGLYTTKLAQALARSGHDVTVCTNALDPSRYLREAPRFRLVTPGDGRLAFTTYDEAAPRHRWRFYWGYLRNCFLVSRAAVGLVRRERFDVITVLDTEYLLAALVYGRHRLPPLVMTIWASNFSFSASAGSPPRRAYKVLQREVFRRALGRAIRAIAVLGEWHRDRLRAQLRLGEEVPIAVIPDGGDVPDDIPDRAAARRRLGLPVDASVFLFFGILRREKGVEHLLEAMSGLPGEGPRGEQIILQIAGWPMEYTVEEINAHVSRLALSRKVRLHLDYVADADVPWYFAACDAVVFPYTTAYTGGTGPLMKGACTYGRPVVATDVSEMGDLVRRHEFGLLARPDDPSSLRERLREFLALSPEARLEMGERSAALARANSWDRMAERFTDLYQLVRDGQRSRTHEGGVA